MPNNTPHLHQLPRGKACLRCRRRKMKCDGSRPTCIQCVRANLLDCEYTDNGMPTTSQLLEETISYLESRIRDLEGEGAPVLLHDPHQAYHASVDRIASKRGTGSLGKIVRSFLKIAPTFGFFYDLSRFLPRLRESIPWTENSPVSSALVLAIELVGTHFCDDESVRQGEEKQLGLVLRAIGSQLDYTRILDTLQTEILLAYYLLHNNRRVEGNYHASAAVSIALAGDLYSTCAFALSVGADGSQLSSPGDNDVEDRVRAFWTVCALERSWSAWTSSTPAWPQDSTTMESILPEVTSLPDPFLALRSRAAILFGEASKVGEKRNTISQAELDTLISRISACVQAVSSFRPWDEVPGSQGGLLLTRTTLYSAIIVVHGFTWEIWEESCAVVVQAALSAVNATKEVDFAELACVDPVLGVLWSIVGQTLSATLRSTQHSSSLSSPTSLTPSAKSFNDDAVNTALTRLLNTMETLAPKSPLIAHELVNLRSSLEEFQHVESDN